MARLGCTAFAAGCVLLAAVAALQTTPPPTLTPPINRFSHPDISARCTHSGICGHTPTPEQCRLAPPTPYTGANPAQLAAARDAALACTFDPLARAERVREAGRWTWKGYRDCAWGWDEGVAPLSCGGLKWFNLSLTAVDGLDSLYVMHLEEEFEEAVELVVNNVVPGLGQDVNLFETTIRIIGGLLSAYRLANETHPAAARKMLDLAVEVGARLAPGFNSPSDSIHHFTRGAGIPFTDVVLSTGRAFNSASAPSSSTSEAGTLSLEFTTLARYTGHAAFEAAPLRVHDAFTAAVDTGNGLLPQFFDPGTGASSGSYIMLGARSDSYYEYLLKQWVLTGKTDGRLRGRFVTAMQGVRDSLLRWTGANGTGLLFVAEMQDGSLSAKMDHLVCFLPGVLALADYHGLDTRRGGDDVPDLEVAETLGRSCYEMYRRSPAGLAPEIVHFTDRPDVGTAAGGPGEAAAEVQTLAESEPTAPDTGDSDSEEKHQQPSALEVETDDVGGGDFVIKSNDAHNLLRPETVESLYLLWKTTGRPIYRERAWLIFRAFEKWTKLQGMEQCRAADPTAATAEVVYSACKVASTVAAEAVMAGHTAEEAVQQGRAAVEAQGGVLAGDATEAALAMTAAVASAAATVEALNQYGTVSAGDGAVDASKFHVKRQLDDDVTARDRAGGCTERSWGGGYTNLESVLSVPPPRRDKTESFWLAETLKYLYLIFAEPPDRCLHPTCEQPTRAAGQDTVFSLDKFVFNTEAHPLPIVGPADASLVAEVAFTTELLTIEFEAPEALEPQPQDGVFHDDGTEGHVEEQPPAVVVEDDVEEEPDGAESEQPELQQQGDTGDVRETADGSVKAIEDHHAETESGKNDEDPETDAEL